MISIKSLINRSRTKGATLSFTLTGLVTGKEEDDLSEGDSKSFDILSREKDKEELDRMYEDRSQLTWTQRLSMMWRTDENGEPSPEFCQINRSVEVAVITGGTYGAYSGTQRIMKNFLERNKYEMFKHPFEAQKALREKLMLTYMKGFLRWGFKIGALTGTYMCVAQSLMAMRNYVNPLDHMAAGMVMGAIYRFNMGPKGMLSAGILGGIIGFQGGCVWWLAQKASGETIEQRWKREYLQYSKLAELKNQARKAKDERNQIISEDPDKDQVYLEPEENIDFLMPYVLTVQKWFRDNGLSTNQITLKDEEDQSLPDSFKLKPK